MMILDMKKHDDNKINLYDCTRVNGWHLERMRFRARNMFNTIKRYIPSKQAFLDFLRSKLDPAHTQIHSGDFSLAIRNLLGTVNEHYHKFDMESLLSVIQFGPYETVDIHDIATIVFE